jgi:hypothetical protein
MGRPLVQDGTALDFVGLPLYPRMHIISDGRVFMSGTNAETKLLKTSAPGSWETVGSRKAGARDYHDNPTDLRQYPWRYGQLGLANFRLYAQPHTQLSPTSTPMSTTRRQAACPSNAHLCCCTKKTPGHTVSSTPIALAMNSWWRPRLSQPNRGRSPSVSCSFRTGRGTTSGPSSCTRAVTRSSGATPPAAVPGVRSCRSRHSHAAQRSRHAVQPRLRQQHRHRLPR